MGVDFAICVLTRQGRSREILCCPVGGEEDRVFYNLTHKTRDKSASQVL